MKKVYDGFVLMMVATVATAVRDVVVFENSIGVALTEGDIGDDISVDTVGVYEGTGATADTFAVGDVVYWDNTNKEFTTDPTSHTLAGTCWSAKAGAVDGTVQVKIG